MDTATATDTNTARRAASREQPARFLLARRPRRDPRSRGDNSNHPEGGGAWLVAASAAYKHGPPLAGAPAQNALSGYSGIWLSLCYLRRSDRNGVRPHFRHLAAGVIPAAAIISPSARGRGSRRVYYPNPTSAECRLPRWAWQPGLPFDSPRGHQTVCRRPAPGPIAGSGNAPASAFEMGSDPISLELVKKHGYKTMDYHE